MQDEHGQVEEAQSISAGLDYPGVGPEHSYLALDRPGRVPGRRPTPRCSTRSSCWPAPRGSSRAFESAHALAWVVREAPSLRGPDRAREPVGPRRQGRRPGDGAHRRRRPARSTMATHGGALPRPRAPTGRKLLVPYITGGYPGWEDAVRAAAAAGADGIEIGIPFSDPVMDGPVIQQASQARARRRRRRRRPILDAAAELDVGDPARRDDVLQPRPPRRPPTASPAGSSPPASTRASCPTCRSRRPGRGATPPTTPGVETVMLAAPTAPDERLPRIAARARGFVYSVGLLGVTGERGALAATATDARRAAQGDHRRPGARRRRRVERRAGPRRRARSPTASCRARRSCGA